MTGGERDYLAGYTCTFICPTAEKSQSIPIDGWMDGGIDG